MQLSIMNSKYVQQVRLYNRLSRTTVPLYALVFTRKPL